MPAMSIKAFWLSLGVFFVTSAFAQTDFRFGDTTASWNVSIISTYGSQPPGNFVYNVLGDAVINGQNYQRIGGEYLRKDSTGKVFRRYGQDDWLLYDFNLAVGDSITTYEEAPQGYFLPTTYYVDAVDTTVIGIARKRITLHGAHNATWVEGIGNLYGDPIRGCVRISSSPFLSNTWDFSLACYSENGQVLYAQQSFCHVSSVSEVEEGFYLYPLPATNQLTLEWNNSDLQSYSIYNAEGKLLSSAYILPEANKVVIDCVAWPAGIYIVQLQTKSGTYYRKVLVEH